MNPDVLLGVILDHLLVIINAVAAVWMLIRSKGTRQLVKDGVEVSTRNENTLLAVRHDLQNGVGEKIAAKAVERIGPALHDAAVVAAGKITLKAEEVAAELAIKTAGWDGVERRVGPPDRRER